MIIERQKYFHYNIDIEKTIRICREMCREDGVNEDVRIEAEHNPLLSVYNDPHTIINSSFYLASLHKFAHCEQKTKTISYRHYQ